MSTLLDALYTRMKPKLHVYLSSVIPAHKITSKMLLLGIQITTALPKF